VQLLEQLVSVHAPSGSEYEMKSFLLDYISQHKKSWKVQPITYQDDDQLHDAVVLVFGKPRTAIFAHMDTVGYTCRYENQLVQIGSPSASNGAKLVGEDPFGPIECTLQEDENGRQSHDFARAIQRGTTLVYKPDFRLTEEFVQTPYLDNRLGVYAALTVAETLIDGMIVFSTHEEHGGGNIPQILSFAYPKHPFRTALISDITWVTDGVGHGEGVVISLRDHNIPRRSFINKVLTLADKSGLSYQTEVEASGSSDGREVHMSPYPIDWCFMGAPEDYVHSPDEKVSIADIQSMIGMYQFLMQEL
jgi:putative aminopeptidase FrvX